MTKRNLVATILAAMLVASCGVANTQADAKSVTPRAVVLNTAEPSTKVASRVTEHRASRSKPRIAPSAKPKKVERKVTKPVTVQKKTYASNGAGSSYSPRWESVRKCIVHRESRGNYAARNPYSSAQGAYQFLDNLWRVPLSEKLNKPHLRTIPIYKWSKSDQDRAFWLVWDNGRGKSHWSLPGHQCW